MRYLMYFIFKCDFKKILKEEDWSQKKIQDWEQYQLDKNKHYQRPCHLRRKDFI